MCKCDKQYNSTYPDAGYPDRQLSGSASQFGKFVDNCTKLTSLEITGYRIQYSVMASRTSNQAWSTQVHIVNSESELQTANVTYLPRKIQLSGFSAHPDGSPSQLICVGGVLLYSKDMPIRRTKRYT